MNFVFISPHFPHTYWQFCDRLHRNGINVLGIGDAPYESLEAPLKGALTEYYRVDSLEDYDRVYRAVAFFAFKYGKIDWIESMNEYWLEQDARLRTDFNVTTGIRADRISFIKEKSLMKKLYLEAGIPTARQHVVSGREAGKAFIREVGYPVIVKPDVGVGATHTWKLENDGDLEAFYNDLPAVPYVMNGGTDSKHFTRICENVYRFGAFRFTTAERAAMHGNDETLSVKSYLDGVQFYYKLLQSI